MTKNLPNELRLMTGPLRCGGPRGLGSFYGRYLPDWFRSLIAETSKQVTLSDEEKAEFADLQDGLDAAFRRFDTRVDPHLANDIAAAVINAALIVSYASEQSKAKLREEAKRHFRSEQARNARGAKQISDAFNRKRLGDAILDEAEAQNRALAISKEFADLIRPGVCKRLGVACRDNWPRPSAIKEAVRRIKKKVNS